MATDIFPRRGFTNVFRVSVMALGVKDTLRGMNSFEKIITELLGMLCCCSPSK